MNGLGIVNWLRWDSDSVDLDLADFTKLLNQNKWIYSNQSDALGDGSGYQRYLLELWDTPSPFIGFWLERPVPLWVWEDQDPDEDSPFTNPNSPFYLDRDVVARDGVDPLSSILILGTNGDPVPKQVEDYLAPLTFIYWESEMWWLVDDANLANGFVAYLNKHGEEVLTDENWKAFKAWKKGGDDAAWK